VVVIRKGRGQTNTLVHRESKGDKGKEIVPWNMTKTERGIGHPSGPFKGGGPGFCLTLVYTRKSPGRSRWSRSEEENKKDSLNKITGT